MRVFEKDKKRFAPLPAEIRSLNDQKRTITFASSTEATDRYGDIIRVKGWDFAAYKKNPVFLWGHRQSDPPIGKCVSIHTESDPPALVQEIEFATKEIYPWADTIYKLYKGGFLKAVSVGFLPLEDPQPIIDEKTGDRTGEEFTRQELLELSAVSVPANPEALGRAVTKGIISEEQRKGLCGEDNPAWSYLQPGVTFNEDEPVPEKSAKEIEVETEDVKQKPSEQLRQFCDEGRRLATRFAADLSTLTDGVRDVADEIRALNGRSENSFDSVESKLQLIFAELKALRSARVNIKPEVPVEAKTVCPYHEEKLAPKDAPWDAPAEMAKQDTPEGWRRMSTVIVSDEANKGSYKLPHHEGSGFATVFRGVTAALGRLEQTDMPPEDRPGARHHLTRHQSEFEGKSFDVDAFEQSLEAMGRVYRSAVRLQNKEAAEFMDKHIEDFVLAAFPPEVLAPIVDEKPVEPEPVKVRTFDTIDDLLKEFVIHRLPFLEN